MNPSAPKQATCQHCKTVFECKRPDLRKWCDRHRLLRGLRDLRQKYKVCVGCSTAYYPWDSASARTRVPTCAVCLDKGESRDTKPCGFCDARDGLLPDIGMCWGCATNAADLKLAGRVQASILKTLRQEKANGD